MQGRHGGAGLGARPMRRARPRAAEKPRAALERRSVARRTRLVRAVIGCLAGAAAAGCDWDWNRQEPAPPRLPPPESPPAATPLLEEPAGAPPGERPSLDHNMGRGFQGVLALRLRAGGESRGMRFLARGNDARLQLDGLGGRGAFDALLFGEQIAVIDSAERTYRTLALDEIRTQPVAGREREQEVRIDETGEQQNLQGVLCERYEIDDGPLHISACVTALPGSFSADKLEAVGGFDVPAWVERLLGERLLPIQASARDARGREAYALELVRYAAGPVDPVLLSLPSDYRPSSASPRPPGRAGGGGRAGAERP